MNITLYDESHIGHTMNTAIARFGELYNLCWEEDNVDMLVVFLLSFKEIHIGLIYRSHDRS